MNSYLIYAYIITFLALIILLLKSVIDFKRQFRIRNLEDSSIK